MDSPTGGAPWWMAGGLFAAWVVREAWAALRQRRKDRTETDANVELIDSLRVGLDRQGQRIQAMEEAYDRIQARLDAEISARMAAQEKAHRLSMRVQQLEAALRGLGAVIPPDVTEQG